MEKDLQTLCKEALSEKNVNGVIALNKDGLCLFSEGFPEDNNVGGQISAIYSLAKELDKKSTPIVQIGNEKTRLLIKEKNSVTTAVLKSG